MVETGDGDGAPESGSRSKPASTFESSGERLRFTVELRPGETTIVSWKKLLKETNSSKPNEPIPSVTGPSAEEPILQPPPPPPPPLDAAAFSKQPIENEGEEAEEQGGTNRLSNVIERIERMYAGNGSSDDEDVVLDDVPDDDEYDTEDSFIDDAELDDYFQVDNSAIKHDGFFVNRGKLERIEPIVSANLQPKKRRRKDLTKGAGASDGGSNPIKHVKIGNKSRKKSTLIERSSNIQSNRSNVNSEGAVSPTSAGDALSNKKMESTKITLDPAGLSNGDGIKPYKDADQLKTGVPLSKNYNKKRKENRELQDVSTQRLNDQSLHISKSQSGKQLNNADMPDQSIHRKEKGVFVERFDLNVPASREPILVTKVLQRKEGSSVRPKTSMLDKAIRELERIVAESRPPSTEVQDPDNSSQGVKRRLSREIKQKLAKVARLAQASYGKIPKDVISRLMGILGHLMQVRTLKRNLKVLASTGLSAKQEKDERMQKIKQEVAEMVKLRFPLIKSKIEQQTANSDDFQEGGPEEKEALKRKHNIDEPLENKICELYDLYAERAEEDSGPPVRRLYEELAALWPSGLMDVDGIKRAICGAKDRKRALGIRKGEQERIRKKKGLGPKEGNSIREEPINVSQAVQIREKILPNSHDHGSSLTTKPLLPSALSQAAGNVPVVFSNGPHVDKPKPAKVKGSSSSSTDIILTDILPKKKIKRKPPNMEVVESRFGPEKLMASQVDDRHKPLKHMVAGSLPKPNLHSAAPSGSPSLS